MRVKIRYLENGKEKTIIARRDRNPLVLLENPTIIEAEAVESATDEPKLALNREVPAGQTNRASAERRGAFADAGLSFLKTVLNGERVVLFLLLFALNTLDAVLTYYAVNTGIAKELNPLYNPFDPVPISKLLAPVVFFLAWLFSRYLCHRFQVADYVGEAIDYALYAIVGIYIAVVASNVATLVCACLP